VSCENKGALLRGQAHHLADALLSVGCVCGGEGGCTRQRRLPACARWRGVARWSHGPAAVLTGADREAAQLPGSSWLHGAAPRQRRPPAPAPLTPLRCPRTLHTATSFTSAAEKASSCITWATCPPPRDWGRLARLAAAGTSVALIN
jgi:hypothetical protein